MRLEKKQKEALLAWVAEGLQSDEINKRSKKFKPPFKVSRRVVDYYRQSRDVNIKEIQKASENDALKSGFAVRENRVAALQQLGTVMLDELTREEDNRLWVTNVKGIGSYDNYERVEYEEFNKAEVDAVRGVFDDIAREVGERQPPEKEDPWNEIKAAALSIPAELIAPDFLASLRAIQSGKYTEFLEEGGRGSTKSSFISLAIIYLIVNNPEYHALITRQVKDTMRDSVYAQLVWAIDQLGLTDSFKCNVSPLEITYLPTGQKIFFRGADEPGKIKSIKPAFGYIAILWFEELDQFYGPETVRNIEQSAIRGGDKAFIFKSFNPPRTIGNWANKYAKIQKANQWHHKSTYLTVPVEWLGKAWLDEAEFLKQINPKAYEHEYLGIANGEGGMVFDNVKLRTITDAEIKEFDNILQGVDWGFYPDPYAWVKTHYDPARLTLYIFDEYRVLKASNRETADYLKKKKGVEENDMLIADSAETKSVADYRDYNLNCRAAEKGKESRKYSYKWLQSLKAIVIDDKRAPETATEFTEAEFPRDKDGSIINAYPEANDHSIDATRYATNLIWKQRGQ